MSRTRNMTKEIGNKIIKLIIKSLSKEKTEPRFRWFDYNEMEWEGISQVLETVLPEDTDINQDPSTLLTLINKWAGISNDADEERKKELNIAALTHVQNLQFNDEGREIWYKYVKKEGEVDWDPRADAQVQDWVSKIARIANGLIPILNLMSDQLDKARGIVEVYDTYETLKDKYCSSDLKIQVMLKKANTEDITKGIGEASDTVRKWVKMLNDYYDYNPTRDWVAKCRFFFPGSGMSERAINWEEFEREVKKNKGTVINYVLPAGGKTVSLKDFPQIQSEIEEMTNLLMNILRETPQESDRRDRSRDDDRDSDRETNKHKYKRIRDMLVRELRRYC